MNIGSLVKVLLIGGGGITSVGALPSIVSNSSKDSVAKSRTKRSTSLNQEGIRFNNGEIDIESYCFYFDDEGIVGIKGHNGEGKLGGWCGITYNDHLKYVGENQPRLKHKWNEEDQADGGKKVLLVNGSGEQARTFEDGDKTHNIIGCFDEDGRWGKAHEENRKGHKIGFGYNNSGKEVDYRNGNSQGGTAKLGVGKCTNGDFDAITGRKKNEQEIIYTFSGGDPAGWEVKYFGDLTWTLER